VTRKWIDIHGSGTLAQDYKKNLKGAAEPGFIAGTLNKEPGRFLNVTPMAQTFSGKVYLLTDSKTSQVSEMLAFTLKRERAATIVGQKTAGSWFLVENIRINNQFDVVLPVASYLSPDGKNLNKTAVEPDMSSGGEDVLQFLLKTL